MHRQRATLQTVFGGLQQDVEQPRELVLWEVRMTAGELSYLFHCEGDQRQQGRPCTSAGGGWSAGYRRVMVYWWGLCW